MINALKMSLKIDLTYAINANMHFIKKLPIFRDLLNDDVYKGQGLKKFARVFSIVLSTIRFIVYRLLYFFVLYFISCIISPNNVTKTFIHIYFIFTTIGMFINGNILSVNTKKYFCIVLFNMNAKVFMKATLFWTLLLSLILNSLGFFVFSFVLDYSLLECIALILFGIFARVIGEAFTVFFYKKKGYVFTADYRNTLVVLGVLLFISALPFVGVFIPDSVIYGCTLVFFILSIFCYKYLMRVDDYKIIYKKLNTLKAAMNSSESTSYARQNMVRIKDKDRVIEEKKIKNKKGYDLFNTIFFERHREILMRSAKRISVIILIVAVVLGFISFNNKDAFNSIHDFILNRPGWLVFIMYFINRGAVVTQAMFYNCDHAMLTYNFYRDENVIVNLFKKRLVTIIKINLLPAFAIVIGYLVLLGITGGSSVINYVSLALFIVILSVFFSVHYLVLYYLLQPYNEDLEMKSYSYTLVSLLTYFICYSFNDMRISSLYFSIFGVIFTLIYIVIALNVVYKKAPNTFRIKR